jgi:hypothetical protein
MKANITYKEHIIHDAEIKTISDHIVSFYLTKNVRNGELIAYIVERIINERGSITCIDKDTYHIVFEKNEVDEIIITEL